MRLFSVGEAVTGYGLSLVMHIFCNLLWPFVFNFDWTSISENNAANYINQNSLETLFPSATSTI